MRITVFPITRIRKLRKNAQRAAALPEFIPSGWSKSAVAPGRLLECFSSIRLKPGFRLRAFQFREGGNGNGFIWALPDGVPFPDPDECPRLDGRFLDPPKPPGAVEVLEAIEGDGSPWSYLSASIFAREAGEFGAMWHGISWGVEEILWRPPFVTRDASTEPHIEAYLLSPDEEGSEWRWVSKPPDLWRPSCTFDFDGATVAFLTRTGLGRESIRLHVDRYRHGSYQFETGVTDVAEGPRGFLW